VAKKGSAVAKKGSAVAKKGSAVAKKGSTAANRLLARDYYHTYYNLTNDPVDCSRLRSFPVPGTHGLDQTGSWWSSSIADWIGPCQSVRSGLQSWTDRTEHWLQEFAPSNRSRRFDLRAQKRPLLRSPRWTSSTNGPFSEDLKGHY
jgi:hypothetical protein